MVEIFLKILFIYLIVRFSITILKKTLVTIQRIITISLFSSKANNPSKINLDVKNLKLIEIFVCMLKIDDNVKPLLNISGTEYENGWYYAYMKCDFKLDLYTNKNTKTIKCINVDIVESDYHLEYIVGISSYLAQAKMWYGVEIIINQETDHGKLINYYYLNILNILD